MPGVPLDRISIVDLEVFAHHGVLPEEKERGQVFLIDLDIDLDASIAARDDDIESTVDYASVAGEVARLATAETYNLIETLASRIAAYLMTLERVERARVTVKKPRAPLGVTAGNVAVTVTHLRSAGSLDGEAG